MRGEYDENSGECSDFVIHNESSGDKVTNSRRLICKRQSGARFG
ncbi:hypothetical protein BN135_2304 [Cronobacter muytjensii 530]